MRTALICAGFLALAVLSIQAMPQEQELGRVRAAREADPVPDPRKRKMKIQMKLKKKQMTLKKAAKMLRKPASRAIVVKGNGCEYITLADLPSNTGCGNGNKFVLKGATGVRKQFLIMTSGGSDKAMIAFVTKQTKFTACTSVTDITTTVTCKAVPNLSAMSLSELAEATTAAGAAAATDAAAAATTAAAAAAEATTAASGNSTCKCGIKGKSRIVNGNVSSPGEWPWIVVANFGSTDGLRQGGCGGTLVADGWVVTAAHCVYGIEGNQTGDTMSVVIGEHIIKYNENGWDYNSDDDEYDTLRKNLEIEKVIIHDDYDPYTTRHDIALLQLKEPLNLTVYMPACLPTAGRNWTNETAWVYGWGTTEFGGAISPVLRETNLTIISNAACNERSGTLNGQAVSMAGRVSDDMLCGERAETDSCQGDSGGPFTVATEGRHTLAGVVSWGLGCGIEGLPGVNSNVSHHRVWIDDTIQANGGATFCAP